MCANILQKNVPCAIIDLEYSTPHKNKIKTSTVGIEPYSFH